MSLWDEDDDGWTTVTCTAAGCGWGAGARFPGAEEAADAWGDHMYDVGYAAGAARANPGPSDG